MRSALFALARYASILALLGTYAAVLLGLMR